MDDFLIDLFGGDVVVCWNVEVEKVFVVVDVEVGFGIWSCYEVFVVFVGLYGVGVDIDVGVDFDGGDFVVVCM